MMFRLILLWVWIGVLELIWSLEPKKSIECETEDNLECKIPFDFGGKTFNSCMLWHKKGEKASVCLPKQNLTSGNALKYSTTSDLKYCSTGCAIEKPVCDECVFPFLYNGKTHNTCLKWHEKANSYPTWKLHLI